MTEKEKIRAEIERLYNQSLADENRQADRGLERAASVSYGKSKVCKELLSFIDSMQEEPVSIWHDANERAEKGRLYLYRTNQNVVDINRSEGKDFPDYCERWAYIDDLFKL